MHLGSTTCIENRFRLQPLPNGPQASKWAFDNPQAAKRSRVHSFARFMFGDAVRRGPMTSVKWLRVFITSERRSLSSLIICIALAGALSFVGDCAEAFAAMVATIAQAKQKGLVRRGICSRLR